MKDGKCCEQVRDGGRWPSYHQCPRNAIVTRDGKPYCRQHDPKAVKERQQKAIDKWKREYSRRDAIWEREAAARNIANLLCDEYILRPKLAAKLREYADAKRKIEENKKEVNL